MKFKAIEVVSIPVADQEVAKAFYHETLGFELVVDTPFEEGKRWIQLKPESGSGTSISLVSWFENMPAGSVQGLVIGVDNVDEATQVFEKNGVRISAAYQTPWGRFANFSDPDGNGWMLHQE
ncbi:MAG: VOC family protein [SAR324 cluster bacterium]|nr:VOC family protein [SAR324 cluster bacterium]